MGRLRPLSARDVIGILERHGFRRVRQRGSHIVVQRQDEGGTTTAIVPDHAEIEIGTLRSIIRQSGLPRQEFESRE